MLLLGAVHMISALAPADGTTLFLNGRFSERLVGAALLVIAALTLRRLRHSLDSLMLTVAIGWAAFAVGAEIVRLDLVSAWMIVHWLLALAGIAMYFVAPRFAAADRMIVPLIIAIGLSACARAFENRGGVVVGQRRHRRRSRCWRSRCAR